MKATVLAALLWLVAGANGFAADLPAAGPVPPVRYVASPVYDWSGFYIGINGGYGFGSSDWTSPLPADTGSFSVDGFLAGGTIGINYQAQQFVFGFEGDADWANLSGSSASGLCFGAAGPGVCLTRERWLGTFRGRVGYAINRLLVFATAGGATGNISAGLNPPGTTDSSNVFGWTVGGGLEAALTENWTSKVEYLYVDLGNGSCPINCGVGVPITVPLTESLVRAGINYKFGF